MNRQLCKYFKKFSYWSLKSSQKMISSCTTVIRSSTRHLMHIFLNETFQINKHQSSLLGDNWSVIASWMINQMLRRRRQSAPTRPYGSVNVFSPVFSSLFRVCRRLLDEPIVTPFAQILATLHAARNKYANISNVQSRRPYARPPICFWVVLFTRCVVYYVVLC